VVEVASVSNASTRLFSLWGILAIGLVIGGAALSRGVVAQEQPLFVSGSDVAPAYQKGNWKATAEQMKQAYKLFKEANWDYTKVPFEMWQHPDQKYAENKNARQPNVTGFLIPDIPAYQEVAFWCETYYRQNVRVFKNHTVSKPDGFFLVMYKDGTLEKVAAKDVRLIPHPTMPEGMIQVFPRMKAYSPDLPQLPPFQNIG
jgi:hypothetical protein